jgi:fucose permease
MGAGAVSPLIFGLVSDIFGVSTSMVILGFGIFLTIPLCLAVPTVNGSVEQATEQLSE